jgi:hypothetical protein
VCFEPSCRHCYWRKKIQCGFWAPMKVLQKRRKNLVCALSPYASIAIEIKNWVCFANDMQILHTLYLSNGKQIKKMGISSLVLLDFLCLWKYYEFIILSTYFKVKALKYYIKKRWFKNDVLIRLMQHYIKKCIKNSWRIKNVLNVIFIQKCSKNYKNEKEILFVLLNDCHP